MEGLTGYLKLSAGKKRGKTIADDIYFYGALKLMRPMYLENEAQACFYIMNPGGGYVGGDQYKMEFELEKEAELLLSTQSATKIYKTLNNPVVQEINITLKEGSLLEYLPDPIIGYKNAKYKQKTVIHMESGTTLISTEIITPGWDPDGDKFSYELLDLNTEVYKDGRVVVLDHLRIAPSSQNIRDIGFLEGYSHIGTMLVIGEQCDTALLSKLHDSLESSNANCKLGLTMLSIPGFIVRILAFSTQDIESAINDCHALIRRDWLGKSPVFLRKY